MIFSSAFCGGLKPTRLWHLTGEKHFQTLIKNKHEAGNRPFYPRSRPQLLQLIALNLMALGGILYSFGVFTPKVCPGGGVIEDKRGKKVCKNIKGQPCPVDQDAIPEKCSEAKKSNKKK